MTLSCTATSVTSNASLEKRKFVQIHTYMVEYRETSRTYYTIAANVGCFMLIVLALIK